MSSQYNLGPFKNLEDLTLEDLMEHPIWVCDTDGDKPEGFDETAGQPIVGATHVTKDIVEDFTAVSVLIKFVDKDCYGCATVWRDGVPYEAVVWQKDDWHDTADIFKKNEVLEIEVIPKILDIESRHFMYDVRLDTAQQKK
ncbi:MAG: hypothetical protein K8I00_00450 [Candidatus Omnitrophica bacterium]|nr:hypothetical protein [Candidatus Omnitrophota bacterium]